MPNASTSLQKQPTQPPVVVRGEDKLKAERVELMLKTVPGWSLAEDGSAILCRYTFLANSQAVNFVKRICLLAARRHHYPDIVVQQGEVTVRVAPAKDDLSPKDFQLARDITRKV